MFPPCLPRIYALAKVKTAVRLPTAIPPLLLIMRQLLTLVRRQIAGVAVATPPGAAYRLGEMNWAKRSEQTARCLPGH